MHQPLDRGPSAGTKLVVAFLAGLIVLLLLFPASGVDTQPPECFAIFFYTVPCEAWVAWAAALLVAGVIGLYLWHRTPISADPEADELSDAAADPAESPAP